MALNYRAVNTDFFKQKTAYEIGVRLVGSEMCIRDSFSLSIVIVCFLFINFAFNVFPFVMYITYLLSASTLFYFNTNILPFLSHKSYWYFVHTNQYNAYLVYTVSKLLPTPMAVAGVWLSLAFVYLSVCLFIPKPMQLGSPKLTQKC